TTILVSHSMEDIAKLVDRVIVLNKGKIYKDGKLEDIFFDAEGLRKIGLSVPQITLLMKKLKNDCPDIDDRIFTVDNAVEELFKILKRKEI
ncbi:MAG TPA: energy-coupling factor transporter ATPase, partial [Clostridia bacterium]|nr:energy-coupling factor transporter ATPase [Clostridia bacterium]